MLDLTPITTPLIETAGAIMTLVLARYVPRIIQNLEDRVNIHLTDQQNAALANAVTTGAGVIETKLDQKVMDISHVNIINDHVMEQAKIAIQNLGDVAVTMGLTPLSVANMIVGAVDTGPRTPTAITAVVKDDAIVATTKPTT